jgi:hypothetical protein
MFLLSSKIDPYSSFTINLGPLYVERVFDSLLTRQGVKDINRMSDVQRFELYLDYLRCHANPTNIRHFAMTQFYRGHFYLQLAHHTKSPEFVQHYREKALCYYQTYLELKARPDESRYYAQWQVGALQEDLHYSWAEAQEALIRAGSVDQLRGEANKRLIEHYIRCKEWKTAYHFSTIAMVRFLDKNPAAHRRWYVDVDAYNWQVLRVHRVIRYKLGHQQEKNIAHATSTQTISKQAQL